MVKVQCLKQNHLAARLVMAFKELDRWRLLMIQMVILNITGIVSTQEQLNTPLLMKLADPRLR